MHQSQVKFICVIFLLFKKNTKLLDLEIIDEDSEMDRMDSKDSVYSYKVIFTTTHLAFSNLPILNLKMR